MRRRTGGLGLFSQTIEFFLLADVGRVGNNFGVIVLLEPANQNGGVETSRVCENDFHITSRS